MEVSLSDRPLLQQEADTIILGVYQGGQFPPVTAAVDENWAGRLRAVVDSCAPFGKVKDVAVVHLPPDLGAGSLRRAVLVGLGLAGRLDLETLRRAAAVGVRAARSARARRVAAPALLGEGPGVPAEEGAAAQAEGARLALYEFDKYKAKGDADKDGAGDEAEPRLTELVLATEHIAAGEQSLQQALERARVLAEATNLARDLANEPGNCLPPRRLAERAREVAEKAGLDVEIWDEQRIRDAGMELLYGVGKGSAEPPRLVVLRYRCPQGDGSPLLALVGKGLTFDTGGIDIKPAKGMEEMRMDKAGACAVLGAMQAIAALRPACNVVGILACAENAVSGTAQRPGDVWRAMNGTTVEIDDTDAEGRLALADALAYAATLKPRWIVDIATLTGSVEVSLGHEAAGLFCDDEPLRGAVLAAGQAAGEKFWHLPMYEEYKEHLKSAVADLKNCDRRPDASNAAVFLREFTGGVAYAHLDIAGTASEVKRPYHPSGAIANGFGVRTLALLAERLGRT